MIEAARDVLTFWFDEVPPEKRFARDSALDAKIAARFGELHARLAAHVPDAWREIPEAMLAAVIVLDQFSRNLFRDDPRAFAADTQAVALTKEAMARGFDAQLSNEQLQFLYMPLMHSEDAADQALSVEVFSTIDNPLALDYAHQHKVIIDRFGRFPHRNAVLGRTSSPEEIEFLKQPGSSF